MSWRSGASSSASAPTSSTRPSIPTSRTSSKDLIERAEQTLYEMAETGKYGQGFQPFARALTDAVDMAAGAYQRDGGLVRHLHGPARISTRRWAGCSPPTSSSSPAARPWARRRSATNIAYHVAKAYKAEHQADGSVKVMDGGVVAFFSLEMSSEQLATRIIAEQSAISSERIRRGKITEDEFHRIVEVTREMQSLPLYIDATGGLTIAQVAARARRLKRQRGLGLIVVDYLQLLDRLVAPRRRGPRAGSLRDHRRPQGAGQGTERADHRAVPAVAPGREPRRQAPAAGGPARVRLDRAGRRRRALHLPRGILPRPQGAAPQHHEHLDWQDADGRA